MTIEVLQQYWALVGAGVLATVVVLMLIYRAYSDSPRGQLLRAVNLHQTRLAAAGKASGASEKAAIRLKKLQSKRDSAKPRHIQEAVEALEDTKALQKIADDQMLIAANHVRKIILEEYPPKRHASLRDKYLPADRPDKKPFTF